MSSLDIKWLDDLATLARERSFTRAAELRHVTQPQFSRRIRALELWAGADLVDRALNPVQLTAAGTELLGVAKRASATLADARARIRSAAGSSGWITLATGRTLARTFVPGWWRGLQAALPGESKLRLVTGSIAEGVVALEQGHADFMLAFAHPRVALALDEAVYESLLLGTDELVCVSAPNARGAALHRLGDARSKKPLAWLAYAPTLALAHILDEALMRRSVQARLQRVAESDFAESLHELALAGLGLAWLPRSLVARDLASGQLVKADAGEGSDAIRFEVRLYRSRDSGSAAAKKVWSLSIAR